MENNPNNPGAKSQQQGGQPSQRGANVDQPQQSQHEREGMEDTDLHEEESGQEGRQQQGQQRQASGGKSAQQGGSSSGGAQSQQSDHAAGQGKHRSPQDEY